MLCHLLALSALIGVPFGNIIGPLVMWLIKREEVPFVDECGKESLNFQISMTIYTAGLAIVCLPMLLIPILGMIFIFAAMFVFIALFVVAIALVVIASLKATEGESYRYPFTIRLIT